MNTLRPTYRDACPPFGVRLVMLDGRDIFEGAWQDGGTLRA